MTRAADGLIRQVDDLVYGAECVFRGLRIFYSRPRLWPYALPPLVCVFLLYGGVLALIHFQAAPALENWLTGIQFPSWLSWLQMALETGLTAILWIASALILLICLGSIYEMFGGILCRLSGSLCRCGGSFRGGSAGQHVLDLRTDFALRSAFFVAFGQGDARNQAEHDEHASQSPSGFFKEIGRLTNAHHLVGTSEIGDQTATF